MVYVACSGGIGGAGALHCAPGRTIHTAPRRAAVPSVSVYASAPAARCIPLASVTGIEPVGHWALEARPFPELTPMILFSGLPAGESDPVAGGRTPCCWLGTSDSRSARPEPPKQEKGLLLPLPSVFFKRRTRVAEEARARLRGGALNSAGLLGRSLARPDRLDGVAQTSFTYRIKEPSHDGNPHHLPAPSRGKKERKLF